ncbi:Hypothetical predicted protein [Podarcis lilfordi]|uniref:Uncharacterized protein n=1 Tax=Podarcis lilfordi TaxID=74358 RepID=A0AA35JUF7_9SAUR|nr:Hypothetical predicted protein [Podarcis lilfordi]
MARQEETSLIQPLHRKPQSTLEIVVNRTIWAKCMDITFHTQAHIAMAEQEEQAIGAGERFKGEQQVQESASEYITELRAIAYCQFADIEERLLERIISGVRDSHLRHKLLAKDDIMMMEAVNIATAFEKDNAHEAAHSPHTKRRTHCIQRDRLYSVDSHNEYVHQALDRSDQHDRSQATSAS